MFNEPREARGHREIVQVIREVRNRWRLKVALRGTAIVLAAGICAFLLSAYGLEYFRFSPSAVVAFRILTYLALAGLVLVFLVLPLIRRVPDDEVALYLEEHEPSLEAAVLSALEVGTTPTPDRSAALVRRLIESTVDKCRGINYGRRLEQESLRGFSGLLAAVVMASLVVFLFGPSYLRHGVSALLFPARSAEAASPYHIQVLPGNVTIARGSDQTITAHLLGFDAEQVDLLTRTGPTAPFERVPMIPAVESDGFGVLLFDVEEETDYFVQSAGVQSPQFTLGVVDLPYVERLELEYHFPAYTGLAPRTVDNGGDIAVLRGTEVRLRAFPTMNTPAGRLLFDESDARALTPEADGAFTASFEVNQEGFYRIELEGPDGELVAASPQYTIDVLSDQPPSVSFVKPGRDSTASPIEEVFVEARADDDFGVRELQLIYSVNGGPEHTRDLFTGSNQPMKEVSAGHTFFLEELELQAGDFLSYYARAADNDQVDGTKRVTSDLYFVQVRAFRKDFRPAESQAGMGGGGAGGADARALSQQQRQIISATFNVIRDRETYSADEYRENLVFLTLAQGRLREQVETLVRRLNSRVVQPDPAFRQIAETLPKAAGEMRTAEESLQEQNAQAALPPEQRALQHLQRAEEAYEEVRVTMGGGGGGGGGSNSTAEDLADLFELELDRLQNQYETMQRGEQRAADDQIDELMERLRELARRQEQEAERQRRRASGQRSGQGAGGASQRALAEEAEEAARRLERLAREASRPDLMDAARRLQEAADAMRRAAANANSLGLAEASAALDRLKDARRRLEQEQSDRLARDIEDALRRTQALADEERDIAEDVEGLGQRADADRREQLQRLTERKDAMETEVASLEQQLDRTSAEFRREERESSRKLQEAADSIRQNKLKEKIRYSKGLIRARSPEYARTFEDEIGSDIEELRQKLSEAQAAIGTSEGDALAEALDRTRDLMRGMGSLEQRIRETGEQGARAQSGGAQQGGDRAADGQRGPLGGFAGGGPWGPWVFTDEEIRQFRREFREGSADAQELRRQLELEGVDVADLDEIIKAMRALDSLRVYADAAEIERLQTYVIEGLKRFEYQLRREMGTDAEQLFLSGSDEVPSGFRELIEEYYRSLSRDPSP